MNLLDGFEAYGRAQRRVLRRDDGRWVAIVVERHSGGCAATDADHVVTVERDDRTVLDGWMSADPNTGCVPAPGDLQDALRYADECARERLAEACSW